MIKYIHMWKCWLEFEVGRELVAHILFFFFFLLHSWFNKENGEKGEKGCFNRLYLLSSLCTCFGSHEWLWWQNWVHRKGLSEWSGHNRCTSLIGHHRRVPCPCFPCCWWVCWFTSFSVSTLLMMVTLKKLASTGCTLVFTINQSSTEVFGLFDRICLLSNGNTLFFGETLACLQVCIIQAFKYTIYLSWYGSPEALCRES